VALCTPHRRGVAPGTKPFRYEGCAMCDEKVRKGLVSSTAGPSDEHITRWTRSRKARTAAKRVAVIRSAVERGKEP
jgi:hypothetical protein